MQISSEIIRPCLKGDSKAQHLLYKTAFPFLIKVCYRYASTREDAIELLNQGFLKIFNALQQYDMEQSFEAWAKRVMINSIIDNHRRNKTYKQQIQLQEREEIEEQEHLTSSNYGEHRLNYEDIMGLIQQLPPLSREVLNLSIIDGYSHKEIAGMLEITEAASKWHLFSARNKLQEWLKSTEMTVSR